MRKRKCIKIIIIILTIILNLLLMYSVEVFASDNTNYITLSDEEVTVNNESMTTNSSESIYLTSTMNNGGSSEDALSANVEIKKVININSAGTYEFSGKLSDGQIAVNSNEINGEVTIILNNVDITCENAPAIFIYNKETNSSTCTITIKTIKGSTNTISGGKLKQSVEGWEDQSKLLYYVDKSYDDDKNYYERYKYDGAISSDISLKFEGEGTLIVNAIEKEGIESKRDITINSGNYIINSLDDGINACTDNESIITINGGTILVNVQEAAEEGDGIDSNGFIYINGGTVYAFACENSQDSGLDSDSGIYINGGYIVGTGNMADEVSENSKQEFMQLQFTSKVSKGTLITITNENKNPLVAFESDRSYTVLTISTPELDDGEHYVYEGGKIEGISENGLYTQITSYAEGTIKEYSNTSDRRIHEEFRNNINNTNNGDVYYYSILILGIILVILIIVVIILKKKGNFEIKGKIVTLIIGIIIGAIIATAGFLIYDKMNINSSDVGQGMREERIQWNGEMIEGEGPSGERPNEGLQEKSSYNNNAI